LLISLFAFANEVAFFGGEASIYAYLLITVIAFRRWQGDTPDHLYQTV